MTGTGVAARAGILIKDAEVLEVARSVTVVAFDKTGTLTEGRPTLVQRLAIRGDDNALLDDAASLQAGSEHPLSKAVLQARSEEHTSELQSLMRISYAVFCLNKK